MSYAASLAEATVRWRLCWPSSQRHSARRASGLARNCSQHL